MDAECDAISDSVANEHLDAGANGDSAGGTDAAAANERTHGYGRASGNTDTVSDGCPTDANAGAGNGNPRPTSG